MNRRLDTPMVDETAVAAAVEDLRERGATGQAYIRTNGTNVCLNAVNAGDDCWAGYSEAASRRAGIGGRRMLPVLDSGDVDGRLWIAYDMGSATSLADRRSLLPTSTARSVLADVARALDEAAAKGVFASELSPDSVFLTGKGARLGDLGTAREGLAGAKLELEPGSAYVAPEVLKGERAGEPAGVYLLGALLHYLLTGTAPPPGQPGPGEHGSWNLPASIKAIVATAMADDPADRPPTVSEAHEIAKRALRGEPPARGRRRGAVKAGKATAATKTAAAKTAPAKPRATKTAATKANVVKAGAAKARATKAGAAKAGAAKAGVVKAGVVKTAATKANVVKAGPEAGAAQARATKARAVQAGATRARDVRARAMSAVAVKAGAVTAGVVRTSAKGRAVTAAAVRTGAARAGAKRRTTKRRTTKRRTPRSYAPKARQRLAAIPLTQSRALGLGGALVLGSVAGLLLGTSNDPEPARAQTVTAGGLAVTLPSSRHRVEPSGTGLAVRAPGSLLRARIVDSPPPSRPGAVPVRLGALQAWRHTAGDVVRYSVPTSGGTLAVTCRATPPAGSRPLALCERTASTLRLRDGRALPLAAAADELRRLRTAVAALEAEREAGRATLGSAFTPDDQRAAAHDLAVSHERAATALRKLTGAGRVEAAARRAAGAYSRLAAAAESQSPDRWVQASEHVGRSDADLAEAIAAAAG